MEMATSTAYLNAANNLTENGGHNELHQYDESFPPLGGGVGVASTNVNTPAPLGSVSSVKPSPIGTPKRLPPRVGPVKTTAHVANKSGKGPGGSSATLLIAPDERRFKQVTVTGEGPEAGAQRRICQDIAARTHVTVDLHVNKDRSLSISITGKPDAVQEAKRSLSRELVTQGQLELDVPQEYYRFILGKSGTRLQEIERNTGARINVPRSREVGEEIIITGSKEAMLAAKQAILEIYQDQVRRAQESLVVPKIYHPFLCGPNNRYLEDIIERTGAKVNVPPVMYRVT
jgi:hypothetical protein